MKSRARFLVLCLALAAHGFPQVGRSANGPYGGWINDLTEDGSGRVLAACAFGGIYRSSDAGESWSQIYDATHDFDPLAIAVAANGHILVGAEGFEGGGIRRSTDDGATWQILSNALSTHGARRLRVMPNGEIFACTFYDDGVYRSTDNGATFTAVSSLPAASTMDIAGNASGHLFVSTRFDSARMYRSTDNGATWQLANVGLAGEVHDIFITASNVLYAASNTGLYRSTDNGTTWSSLNAPAAAYESVIVVPGGVIYAAFMSASLFTGGGVYRSTDDGATWTQDSGLPAKFVGRLLRTSGGVLFSGGAGQGVYRRSGAKSTAGADWEWKNHGLANTWITAIEQDVTSGTVYAGTAHAGVFRSVDRGATWQSASAGIPEYEWINALAVNTDGTVFASGAYDGIYRSVDGGITWTNVYAVAATALACNADGRVFAGYGSRMYRSTDNGATWSNSILQSVQNIADIAFDGAVVYVATGSPFGFGSQGVRRSTDNGVTWAAFNDGLTDLDVTSVEVGPQLPGEAARISCGTDGSGVFSLDETAVGKAPTWIPCGIAGAFAKVVALKHKRALYVAEMRRLRTEDTGPPAEPCALGQLIRELRNDIRVIDELLYLDKSLGNPRSAATVGSTLLVGTTGGGVIQVPSSPVGIEPADWVRRSALTQNHPNPFNPRTQISFVIGEYGPATLRVYDVQGRELATLVDGPKHPGIHEATWDASERPSGVYYYQLKTEGQVETKKMVLLK